MAAHKWWRIKNIVNRAEYFGGARTVAIINFNVDSTIESTFTNSISNYNLNQSSDKAFDSNVDTIAHSTFGLNGNSDSSGTYDKTDPAIQGINWYIGCKFKDAVEIVTVTLQMRQDMQSHFGQEWQTADIEYSDDGTNWILYGYIKPNIATLDLTLKTIPIEKSLEIRTNLELPVGNYWWNITANSNPIFAIDSTSQIEFEGAILRYANNPNNYFISDSFTKNAVEKSNCYGIKTINYTQLFDYFYTYKSLKFKKIRFRFKEVLNYPENFTLILYTKVYTNSCFLGKSGTGGDHGPAWERVPVNNDSYTYNWRYDSEITGQNYSYAKRNEVSKPHISYVVYTGNLISGKVKAYTPYGLYDLTTSRHFKSDINIDLLGYSDNFWNVDADIIAFGIFDKEFTTEEISSVLSKIETDFKVDQKAVVTESITQLLNRSSMEDLLTTSEKIKMNLYNFYKPTVQKSNNLILEKIYTKNLKISKYGNIFDYIYEEGQPVISKIFLIERITGQLIATTMSNQLGYFEFKGIDKNLEYMVISPHKQYQFKSVIKDYTK